MEAANTYLPGKLKGAAKTALYLLVRGLSQQQAIDLVRESFAFIAGFEGDIPGAAQAECGNYLEHDLPGAKEVARDMCRVLEFWTPDDLAYER